MKKLNVMSLFNGMSFGMMALETLGVEVGNYYSSEIDKYANQATEALFNKPLNFLRWGERHHPEDFINDTGVLPTGELEYQFEGDYDKYLFNFLENPPITQVGDVTKWREWDIDWSSIDLLLAGFPCQAWSMAGKQKGDNDPRGALVHDLIDIWNHIKSLNPDMKFMFENVKMKKEFLNYINELFGVEPICINSALVSAQNRVRYYWTNIEGVDQPEDKGVVLSDIIEQSCDDVNSEGWHKWWEGKREFQLKKKYSAICNDGSTDKAICMTARQYASWNGNFIIKSAAERGRGFEVRKDNKANCLLSDGHQSRWLANDGAKYRKLTPRECFRLQTVPGHHIDTLLSAGISNTQLYKMTGNGWTHDVIVHIFKGLLN